MVGSLLVAQLEVGVHLGSPADPAAASLSPEEEKLAPSLQDTPD